MKKHLCEGREGIIRSSSEDVFPLLDKHWSELAEGSVEIFAFQGIQVLEGWIVVGLKKTAGTKQNVMNDWLARHPSD